MIMNLCAYVFHMSTGSEIRKTQVLQMYLSERAQMPPWQILGLKYAWHVFFNPTKTLSLVPGHLHISGNAHTHLKGIAFLFSFKALKKEKRILETEKCQTGNLWQAAQQGMILIYLQRTNRRNNINKCLTFIYLGLRIVWASQMHYNFY